MLVDLIKKINTNWRLFLLAESQKSYFHQLDVCVKNAYQFKKCVPASEVIFRAFSFCNIENIKVVILGQDPYYQPANADGLAFSCLHSNIPASLKNIFLEMNNEKFINLQRTGDLTYLAKQGVLLLNMHLTVEVWHPLSHGKFGWQKLVTNCLHHLMKTRKVIFLLWGREARQFVQNLQNDNYSFFLESAHPSPLSCHGFFGNNHFKKCNDLLVALNEKPIEW